MDEDLGISVVSNLGDKPFIFKSQRWLLHVVLDLWTVIRLHKKPRRVLWIIFCPEKALIDRVKWRAGLVIVFTPVRHSDPANAAIDDAILHDFSPQNPMVILSPHIAA